MGLLQVRSSSFRIHRGGVISNNPKDRFVIDLACAANAYITTGNAKHFAGYERTVSPAEALDLLRG